MHNIGYWALALLLLQIIAVAPLLSLFRVTRLRDTSRIHVTTSENSVALEPRFTRLVIAVNAVVWVTRGQCRLIVLWLLVYYNITSNVERPCRTEPLRLEFY